MGLNVKLTRERIVEKMIDFCEFAREKPENPRLPAWEPHQVEAFIKGVERVIPDDIRWAFKYQYNIFINGVWYPDRIVIKFMGCTTLNLKKVYKECFNIPNNATNTEYLLTLKGPSTLNRFEKYSNRLCDTLAKIYYQAKTNKTDVVFDFRFFHTRDSDQHVNT